jgi:DNA-binding GntR family transcriptional regulator
LLRVPGADLDWSAELHTPILEALRSRDADAVVDALRHHFDEVRNNMADRWPDDEPTGIVNLPRSRRKA